MLQLGRKKQQVENRRGELDDRVLFMVEGNGAMREENREMQANQDNRTQLFAEKQQ